MRQCRGKPEEEGLAVELFDKVETALGNPVLIVGEQGLDAVVAWVIVVKTGSVIEAGVLDRLFKNFCIFAQQLYNFRVGRIIFPFWLLDSRGFDNVVLSDEARLVSASF